MSTMDPEWEFEVFDLPAYRGAEYQFPEIRILSYRFHSVERENGKLIK